MTRGSQNGTDRLFGVVHSVVTSGLYANFLLGDDEKLCLQLLKRLMELQLVPCDNPRRLLRHGSCAFSRLYKAFTEGLFSAKVSFLVFRPPFRQVHRLLERSLCPWMLFH